ncbi:MAG: TIGR04002 family protein [Oscillospiraceae bacterium]|nr:TIGR04002 family protein [Oscillospiraceae bacterium]
MPRNKHVICIVLTALLAAMTAALMLLHIVPQPNGGYLHAGDAVVYLAACLLPMPYAMAAGAIGGGLADVLGGAAMWAPATLVIKSLLTVPFGWKRRSGQKLLGPRAALAVPAASLISILGYYAAELILFPQNWRELLLYSVPGNALQAVFSAALFLPLAAVLDRSKLTDRLLR